MTAQVSAPLHINPRPSHEDHAHIARCESPLCFEDAGSRVAVVWYSDEPICGVRGLTGELRHAQIVMRRLARVDAPGFFTLADLSRMRRVSRRARGWDPDAPFDRPHRLPANVSAKTEGIAAADMRAALTPAGAVP